MGDSFSDLWSTNAPANQKNKPMGSLSAQNTPTISPQAAYGNKRTTPDIFSMLASSGTPGNSRPITPQPQRVSPKPPASTSTNGDAFSELFSGSSATTNTSKLTLAQQAAQKAATSKLSSTPSPAPAPAAPSAWDGLDSLGGFSSVSPAPTASLTSTNDIFDVGTPAPVADNDDWGLSDFVSAPAPQQAPQPTPQTSSGNIWDSDDFASSNSRSDSPSNNFNFGSREDAGSDDEWGVKRGVGAQNYEDDDDILGDLGKPVDHAAIQKKKQEEEARKRAKQERAAAQRSNSGSSSPPPHVLGELVSMGFSVPEAKAALVKANGNPEAAVEILVSSGGSGSGSGSRRESPVPPPRRPAASNRQNSSARASPNPSASGGEGFNTDKLMAQATEVGTSLWKSAGAIWKSGKEQVQKAYEERVAASSGTSTPSDGRPKWMRDAEGLQDDDRSRPSRNASGSASGFKDEDGEGPVPTEHPSSRPPQPKARPRPKPSEPEVDLFNSAPSSTSDARRFVSREDEDVYIPRRKAGPTRRPAPTQAPPPPTLPVRKQPHPSTQVSISPSQTSSAKQHVSRAENAVKLGQYPVAVDAYSAAISVIPEGHVQCLNMLLGRGEARMRDGDSKGAHGDAEAILAILIPSGGSSVFNPSDWAPSGSGVNLGQMYVGALKMRAQSNEAKEKWKDAITDWERINGLVFASGDVRGEASRGRGRCKNMLDPKPKPPAATTASKTKAPIYKPKVQTSGAAVAAVRKANQAQENEDDEKFRLKDTVDGKIEAWKKGKETNIRALLGSLDMVLWPGLGLKKIGLHELVQEKQVKICYMRAVGRIHPDKITPGNSTLEQRMIANAAFGVLNEAWNAHQG
ncbi:hypothetical protein DL96DRAFT_1591288 [Flagelloscypha sp. PMI_526]|nr:hypothetical protein DL96DRAFT_1591288 [Flagelloscypha sp. PMI_526]